MPEQQKIWKESGEGNRHGKNILFQNVNKKEKN